MSSILIEGFLTVFLCSSVFHMKIGKDDIFDLSLIPCTMIVLGIKSALNWLCSWNALDWKNNRSWSTGREYGIILQYVTGFPFAFPWKYSGCRTYSLFQYS